MSAPRCTPARRASRPSCPKRASASRDCLPPVVAAPAFAIRKPAVAVFTLDDYVAAGIMTSGAGRRLCARAVAERRNILVAGGTSTGKTTLTNALLAEVAKTADRVVLIEDTRELQCKAPNLVALRTKDGVASLSDLVRSSLRLRPDRIPIGEVRGAEALDLLKAWGTGHPGGIGTIHAGSALGALRRLEQLIQEAVVTVPRALIAETIDVVAVLAGRGVRAAARRTRPASTGLGPAGDYALSRSRRPAMIRRRLPHPSRISPTAAAIGFVALTVAPRLRCRLEHAVGAAAQSDPAIGRRAGRQDHRGDHHHRHRADAGVRRHLGRLPPADPDRVRSVDRVRRVELLPVVLLVRRRGADLMAMPQTNRPRLRRARASRADRADPARRRAARRRDPQRHARRRRSASVCGCGSPGLLLWVVGHAAAVWAAKRDPTVRRCRAPASAHPRPSQRREARR